MSEWKQAAVYFYIVTLITAGILVIFFTVWKIHDCKLRPAKARYTDVSVSDDDEEEEIELAETKEEGEDESVAVAMQPDNRDETL
jgi:cytoskeletal protein RodZ